MTGVILVWLALAAMLLVMRMHMIVILRAPGPAAKPCSKEP